MSNDERNEVSRAPRPEADHDESDAAVRDRTATAQGQDAETNRSKRNVPRFHQPVHGRF